MTERSKYDQPLHVTTGMTKYIRWKEKFYYLQSSGTEQFTPISDATCLKCSISAKPEMGFCGEAVFTKIMITAKIPSAKTGSID